MYEFWRLVSSGDLDVLVTWQGVLMSCDLELCVDTWVLLVDNVGDSELCVDARVL